SPSARQWDRGVFSGRPRSCPQFYLSRRRPAIDDASLRIFVLFERTELPRRWFFREFGGRLACAAGRYEPNSQAASAGCVVIFIDPNELARRRQPKVAVCLNEAANWRGGCARPNERAVRNYSPLVGLHPVVLFNLFRFETAIDPARRPERK